MQRPHEKATKYFWDKIFPSLFSAALVAGFALITMYFRVQTLSDKVLASEEDREKFVTKDVFKSSEDDIAEIKTDIKEIRNALIARGQLVCATK